MKRPARKPEVADQEVIEAAMDGVEAAEDVVEEPKGMKRPAAEEASSRSRQNDGPVLKWHGSWKAGLSNFKRHLENFWPPGL